MSNVNEPVFTEIVNRLNEMNERVFGKGEAFTLEDRALLKRVTQQVQGTIDGLADPKPMTAKPDVWERLRRHEIVEVNPWTAHKVPEVTEAIARGLALERVAEAARVLSAGLFINQSMNDNMVLDDEVLKEQLDDALSALDAAGGVG